MNEPTLGRKDDVGKDPWDLLPMGSIQMIVKVLEFGVRKYEPNGWMHVPNARERYFAAMMRHLVARREGEIFDPDSGLLHMAHVGCNAVFLLWFDLNRPVPANK